VNVTGIVKASATWNSSYRNFNKFTIVDATDSTKEILVFRSWGTEANTPLTGDKITIVGYLQNWKGTPQVASQNNNGDVTFTLERATSTITLTNDENVASVKVGESDVPATATNGTKLQLTITCATGYKVSKVNVNGTDIDANTDGTYTVLVAGSTTITITSVNSGAKTPEVFATLSCPGTPSDKVNAYTSSFTNTIGDYTWTLNNINNGSSKNNWTEYRVGRGSYASTASIVSNFSEAVTSVVINFTTMESTDKIKSIRLIVATDADFTNVVETVSLDNFTTGEKTFEITTPTANCYYKIEIDCDKMGENGYVRFDKIEYYALPADEQ